MGRSVETHSRAVSVTYFKFEPECPDDSQWEWDYVVEDIQQHLPHFFPSLDEADEWAGYPYRETRIILQNSQVNVCIAEYCGLVALSVVPRGCLEVELEGLAERNALHIGNRIEKIWGSLRKLGTFSNGEAVFERSA